MMSNPQHSPPARTRMPVEDALRILGTLTQPDQVVVTNQMAARLWPHVRNTHLDLNYNPSTMGGAVPFALGLALSQPAREVIVISGEGALLMSLGSLVTVVDSGVKNLTVVVADNGMYEVTGGQRTPASRNGTNFCGLATAAGFAGVASFDRLDRWERKAADCLSGPGPRFVQLRVDGCRQPPRPAGPPLRTQIEQLRSRLREDPR